jgi:hypothetical protein
MSHLNMWTIYDNPSDYPGKFVVRRWIVKGPLEAADDVIVCDTLEEARSKIPEGLVGVPRAYEDALCTVETWF